MVSVDHLTSAFSPYNYCYYFLKDWFSKNLFPLSDDASSRFVMSPSDKAFLMRSTRGKNNSDLDFPFFSIYPKSMIDENDKFQWTTLSKTRRPIERDTEYNIRYQNMLLEYECIYFSKEGFDEIMRLATVMEFQRKQNITYEWVISTSVQTEPGVLLPIKVKVPIHLMIGNLDLNPVWKEDDWLTQNKIFTLDCSLRLQTLKPIIEIEPSYKIESMELNVIFESGDYKVEETVTIPEVENV